ncbi:MAG: hypothetical protein ACKVQW_09705 [Pyrinomonadaceae bacterium]
MKTERDILLNAGELGEVEHWVRYGQFEKNVEKQVQSDSIEGLESLLENLGKTAATSIIIHKVYDEIGRLYRVFTDSEMNVLFGVLRFPAASIMEPYSKRVEKFKKILTESYGTNENPWISKDEIEKATFEVTYGNGVLLNSIRDIYTVRSRINKERGSPIDGFECFLKNFGKVHAKTVLTHTIADRHKREYLVFTNPEITELIGMLRFPIKIKAVNT